MRTVLGLCVLGTGLLTLAAPWLAHAPGASAVLTALGCRSLPV